MVEEGSSSSVPPLWEARSRARYESTCLGSNVRLACNAADHRVIGEPGPGTPPSRAVALDGAGHEHLIRLGVGNGPQCGTRARDNPPPGPMAGHAIGRRTPGAPTRSAPTGVGARGSSRAARRRHRKKMTRDSDRRPGLSTVRRTATLSGGRASPGDTASAPCAPRTWAGSMVLAGTTTRRHRASRTSDPDVRTRHDPGGRARRRRDP